MPLKKLGIPDLILYLKDCLDIGDYAALIVMTLMVTLFGMVITPINRVLTGFVLDSGSTNLLVGTAVFMLTAILSSQIITSVRELMMSRLEIKTSLAVEAAVMMRIMNLPANFFRKFSSGELSSRSGSVNQLCTLLLGSVFSTGLTSLYKPSVHDADLQLRPRPGDALHRHYPGKPRGEHRRPVMQIRIGRQIMELSAKSSGISYALISGVQKVKLAGARKARLRALGGRLLPGCPLFL